MADVGVDAALVALFGLVPDDVEPVAWAGIDPAESPRRAQEALQRTVAAVADGRACDTGVAVALLEGGVEPLGVLAAVRFDGAVSDEMWRAVELAAPSVAAAVTAARTAWRLRAGNDALMQASALAASVDRGTLGDLLCRAVLDVMPADSCTLTAFDHDAGCLVPVGGAGYRRGELRARAPRIPLDRDMLMTRAFRAERPMQAALDGVPLASREWLLDSGFGSFLHVPLKVWGDRFGVISLSRLEPGVFPLDVVDALGRLGEQAALVMAHDEALRRQGRRTAYASLVNEVVGALAHALDQETVARVCVEHVGQALGADRCMALWLGADGSLRPVAEWLQGCGRRLAPGADLRDAPAWQRLAAGERVVCIADVARERDARLRWLRCGWDRPPGGGIMVRVDREGQPWGAVAALIEREPRSWSHEEAEFLAAVARQVGAALERAALHERVRRARDDLGAVLDQLPEGVVVTDVASSTVVAENPAARDLLGGSWIGLRLTDDLPVEVTWPDGRSLRPEEYVPLRAAVEGSVRGVEVRVRRPDRTEPLPMVVSAVRLDNLHGPPQVVTVFRDISALRSVDRLREEFIRVASHELRTPLTSMRAAVEFARDRARERTPEAREAGLLDGALQAIDRMDELVGSMLDASRLQVGRLTVRFDTIDLRAVVAACVRQARARRGGRVLLRLPSQALWVRADPLRLGQVIDNLVENALRYGGRRTWVTAFGRDGRVLVRVRDLGPGVPARDRERIFERYVRGGDAAGKAPGGLGLGLYVARELARVHGGDVRVLTVRRGAAFGLLLPALDVAEGADE